MNNNKRGPILLRTAFVLIVACYRSLVTCCLWQLRHRDIKRFTVELVDPSLRGLVHVSGWRLCRRESVRNPRSEDFLPVFYLKTLHGSEAKRSIESRYRKVFAFVAVQEFLEFLYLVRVILSSHLDVFAQNDSACVGVRQYFWF